LIGSAGTGGARGRQVASVPDCTAMCSLHTQEYAAPNHEARGYAFHKYLDILVVQLFLALLFIEAKFAGFASSACPRTVWRFFLKIELDNGLL
jgi:hypothetical protein